MTTRAGCECVAHALQGLTELDPQATITSVDGVVAFDLISRRAMLEGLREVNAAVVPFARLFYGQRSKYLWENDLGEIHTISQGEGGEQGDAMMPLLYSLGQHRALEDVARHFSLCPLTGWAGFTTFLRCLCGDTRASESTWTRHKCGIVQASGRQCAIVWRGLLRLSTLMPECGGVHICPPGD